MLPDLANDDGFIALNGELRTEGDGPPETDDFVELFQYWNKKYIYVKYVFKYIY